jgi:GNAT superfamily N-acetyltransferase
MQWTRNGLILTDDLEAVDLDFVEEMLRGSYWAASRPRSDIERSVAASLNFAVLADGEQVGYARVVTDSVTFAWIGDVVVSPDFRGRGIGKWIVECLLEHPAVAPTTQKLLKTRDAHGLYRQFGFEIAECMVKKTSSGG